MKKIVLGTSVLIILVLIIYSVIRVTQLVTDDFVGRAVIIPMQFTDRVLFESVIRHTSTTLPVQRVTGITVPHHLLARDLIADMFARARGGEYDVITIISPDHFWLGSTAISVAMDDFGTVFGTVKTNQKLVSELMQLPEISVSDFFYREHGIQAELPFVAYHFPKTPIVAITLKANIGKDEVDRLITVLKKVLTKKSLIVQSTDFSHYLTKTEADKKDAETVRVLGSMDPNKLWELDQPDHMDSIAAQYVQSRLQSEFFGSTLEIIDRKNSEEYAIEEVVETTSYITQLYTD